MRKQRKFMAALLLGLFVCMVWSPFAYADVKTTDEGAATGKVVYVAGNPNAYPVEYYNEESGEYEGIMPSLLEEVSKECGINFVYIKAGARDLRARLAENRQVEMVSGCVGKEPWLKETGAQPGASFTTLLDENDKPMKLYMAYTDIADPMMVKKTESALKVATEKHLTNIALTFMVSHPVSKPSLWLYIWPTLLLCMTLAFVFVSVRYARYRKENEEARQIDFRTGIYNKAYFLEFYDKFISDRYRNLYSMVYIAFNIGHVKESYDEEAADAQLCYAANELKLSVKDNEVVARVSAGGFGIIRFSGSEEEATEWTEQILAHLNTYHQYDDRAGADMGAMFYGGVYMLEPADKDCEKALFKAQKSYLKAVNEGVPCLVTSQEQLVKEAKEQLLKREILDGLINGEFKMFLQFGVYANDGTICGAEAFSRWEHPTRGLLSPGSYIPLLEAQGAISALDFYIFEEACRTLEKWTQMGNAMVISCNFARMSIEQADFVQQIEAIAAKYVFERRLMLLEISESAMDRNHTLTFENITKCKALGFSVALDDVGQGMTDFADFRYDAITLVKLDRALLNAAVTPRGEALLRGIIKMIHELGIYVLCEGAETEQQFKLLQALGCDFIQGYYFYHPLPLYEAEKVLEGMEQHA